MIKVWEAIKRFVLHENPLLRNLSYLGGAGSIVIVGFLIVDHLRQPAVGLYFNGNILVYLKPDTSLSDDLKKLGYTATNDKIVGMVSYNILNGTLTNSGGRDAPDVEVKIPVDGVLKVATSVMDQGQRVELSKDFKTLIPNTFVSVGPLRADDSLQLIIWYSPISPISPVVFRYKQGDETCIVRFAVSWDSATGASRISMIKPWGIGWKILLVIVSFSAGVVTMNSLWSLGTKIFIWRAGKSRAITASSQVKTRRKRH